MTDHTGLQPTDGEAKTTPNTYKYVGGQTTWDALVAGTAVLMWMGEMISQRGIGNGISMIIFASVVASLPGGFYSILQVNKWFWFFVMIAVTLLIIFSAT